MKLVGRQQGVRAGDEGESVQLMCTEPEDMWHAHNLILPNDLVRAHTMRRVASAAESTAVADISASSRGKVGEKVHTEITVKVVRTFFDPVVSRLHVTGTVAHENPYAPLGSYHTLDLELHRPWRLWKAEGWDSVSAQMLREALMDGGDGLTGARQSRIAAVVMQEGLANVCVVTENRTVLRQRVEAAVPRKAGKGNGGGGGRGGGGSVADQVDAAINSWFERILDALVRQTDVFGTTTSSSGDSATAKSISGEPKPLVLASPGFTAADFRAYLARTAAERRDKQLAAVVSSAIVVHSSSGHEHALAEVMRSPQLASLMQDARWAREARAVEELRARIRRDDGRAWYGESCVVKAVREGAVGRGGGTLFLSSRVFDVTGGEKGLAERKKWVDLVDAVRASGGEVLVLSKDHESGKSIESLGGVAALLTFPLYDLDEDASGEDEYGQPRNFKEIEGDGGLKAEDFM